MRRRGQGRGDHKTDGPSCWLSGQAASPQADTRLRRFNRGDQKGCLRSGIDTEPLRKG